MEKLTSKEYLKRIIEWHCKQNKVMPEFEWMFNKISLKIIIKRERLNKLLDELVEEKFLIQKEGKLFINPNRNFVSSVSSKKDDLFIDEIPAEAKIDNPITKNEIVPPTNNDKNKKPLFNFKKISLPNKIKIPKLPKLKNHITEDTTITNAWIKPLKILLLIIGTGATYMSIYYSYKWLLDFLDPVRAFMLALIMVIFAVVSFELIILFRQRKQYLLVAVFSILWLIVTSFSMTSTIAGQYNSRIEKLNSRYEKESELQISSRKNNEYEEQKKEYQDNLKMMKEDFNQVQILLSQYKTKEEIVEGGKIYNRLFWRSRKVKSDMNKVIKQLRKLRLENKNTSNKLIKKNAPDFYVWISMLFHYSPLLIQFWLSVFPALFIDIIAPLSFAIVMFIKVGKE
jgi:hypothetical protein